MRRDFVFGLRARNVDVLTAAEADMINRQDEDHLTAAAVAGRALLTYNTAGYCALHQRWMNLGRTHTGIIVAPQQQPRAFEDRGATPWPWTAELLPGIRGRSRRWFD